MPITYRCEYCRKETSCPPSQFKRSKMHFCSRACARAYYNPIQNKRPMSDKTKEKLRQARLNPQATGYEKYYGRHTHRVVAEQMLGRTLRPGEIVHHIDGDKRNNRPENLYVFSDQKRHSSWHNNPWPLKGGGADAQSLHTDAASGEGADLPA